MNAHPRPTIAEAGIKEPQLGWKCAAMNIHTKEAEPIIERVGPNVPTTAGANRQPIVYLYIKNEKIYINKK